MRRIREAKYHKKGQETGKVKFQVVIDDNEENKKFFVFTPVGTIEMAVLNEKALEQFEVGKEYYVDFTLAE